MTSTASLLTVAIGALCSTLMAQTIDSLPVYNLPGRLASFLTDHPGAIVERKSLGSLAGRNETGATFAAIIASDMGHPNVKEKGLEVRIMHQDYRGQLQETMVYLDGDSLRLFQLGLEEDVETQEFVAAHPQEFDPLELEKPHVAGAVNHVTGAQDLLKIKADCAPVIRGEQSRSANSPRQGFHSNKEHSRRRNNLLLCSHQKRAPAELWLSYPRSFYQRAAG